MTDESAGGLTPSLRIPKLGDGVCEDCGLVYLLDEHGWPKTVSANGTCEDCGGDVEPYQPDKL